MKYEPWDRPGQTEEGYDIKNMIHSASLSVDSRPHILI